MNSSNKAERVFHEQISRSEEKEQMNNHCAWFESQYGKNATVDCCRWSYAQSSYREACT